MFLSAGGNTNGPVEAAVKLASDRARVIDIGKMKLDLPWNAYYEKELDVRFSRSYGPGRYDTRYELDGIDYPAGYVRWTEKRNLESFLDLLARNELEVATLIDGVFPMADAAKVYEDLKTGALKAIGVLLEYPVPAEGAPAPATKQVLPRREDHRPFGRLLPAPGTRSRSASSVRATTRLPCCCRTWPSCLRPASRMSPPPSRYPRSTRRRSSASSRRQRTRTRCSSDESLDAIFIVTRHATHARLVCRALETGKAVFVEKPLALTREETDQIAEAIEKTGNDRLMVGFNRRFAPLLPRCGRSFGPAAATASTRYLVNAGPLAKDSWYLNEEAEGSRFTGEGGHFIDTLTWWADSLVEEVYAVRGPEKGDVQATFRFANGASGTIAYLTGGNARFPKETMDATGGGRQRPARQLQDRGGLDRARQAPRRRGAARTRASDPRWRQFVEAVRTGARCRSASTPCSPPRGPRSRWARAC